jgi:hypothetical protein
MKNFLARYRPGALSSAVSIALVAAMLVGNPSFAMAAPAADDAGEGSLQIGLVGHWMFGESDGKTVADLSGRGNTGQIEFGSIEQEKATQSLQFDGLGSSVLIRETKPLEFSDAISAAIWVKAAQWRNRTVLFGEPNPTESWTTPIFGMSASASDNRVVFGLWLERGGAKTLVESPDPLPLAQWLMLVGTYDGSAARLYINGQQVSQEAAHGGVTRMGQPLWIGKGRGDKPAFKGRVGELRLYDRALTADEVHGLYEATKTYYDLSRPQAASAGDGTVIVETHGKSPDDKAPWRPRPTRLLELVKGYSPSGTRPNVDQYGGWLDRPRQPAAGFFRVERIDGRQWLIDPERCLFFHVAINTVWEPRNIEAGFGSADRWAQTVTSDLRANGFNGLGNGSSQRLQEVKPPLIWVLRRDFMFSFARKKKLVESAAGTQGFTNRCMPVFHPEFEAFCHDYAAGLAETTHDPYLLGIMTDNELQCPVDLLDRNLALDATNADLKPNRDAAAEWLKSRHGSTDSKTITAYDRYQFIAYAFERYYRIVTKAIREFDTNHLCLGSRLNYATGEFDNPYFWKAIAPYHDVISVNYYTNWGPDPALLADWEQWAGRPILFTEWYAKAMDVPGLANRLGAGWLVRTQEDRARYYQHFALGCLEAPNVVGWHFFKYADDPSESKALDSAGGTNKGMFDLEGRPYLPLLDRARAVNFEVYPLIEFFQKRSRQEAADK